MTNPTGGICDVESCTRPAKTTLVFPQDRPARICQYHTGMAIDFFDEGGLKPVTQTDGEHGIFLDEKTSIILPSRAGRPHRYPRKVKHNG